MRALILFTIPFLVFLGHSTTAIHAAEGRVLLTVSGETSDGNAVEFDRQRLEELDWVRVETFTPFTTGLQVFHGPRLEALLDAVGAKGSVIIATAINDYSVRIPIEHAAEHGVILALDNNGVPMRVRNKGPIWIIYPVADRETEETPFDSEMIWQLNRIEIVE